MSAKSEYPQLLEINVGERVHDVAFTANCKNLVSGSQKGVQVWRVQDGQRVATMPVEDGAWCVATSRDGRWIAAGSLNGEVFVWDAKPKEDQIQREVPPAVASSSYVKQSGSTPAGHQFQPLASTYEHSGTKGAPAVTQPYVYAAAPPSLPLRHLVSLPLAFRSGTFFRWPRVASYTSSPSTSSPSSRRVALPPLPPPSLLSRPPLLDSPPAVAPPLVSSHRVVCADFSPDSTHVVFANGNLNTATIWNTTVCQKVRTLSHDAPVVTAKFSQQGDQIVTATDEFIRVWDSSGGQSLLFLGMGVVARHALVCRDNYLFAITKDRKIMQIDVLSWSTVSEWPVLETNPSCIALPQYGEFIAYSANKMITFLDMSANTRPSPIQHSHDIDSIEFSFDGEHLAIASETKITVKDPSSAISRFVSDLELDIDSVTLNAWKAGRLSDAEALLSVAALTQDIGLHNVLASRALVRARLGNWDTALVDAKESIGTKQSLLAYVAKSVALVGKGEKDEAIQVCDIAFQHFHSEHVSLLLLIKAVILSIAGDHVDAISRVDDLITDNGHPRVDPVLYQVQAYLRLLLGNKLMEANDYERAIQSFKAALDSLDRHTRQPPLVVTLMSGWCFDDLALTIQRCLCEALLAAGHTRRASQYVRRMTKPNETWVSDFKHRCCSKANDLGDSAMNDKEYDEAISQYTTGLLLDPASPQDLLVKRSRAYTENGKWRDALSDANKVIILDPSSPSGYERKRVALLGLNRYDEAIDTFETMLLKMSESSDPEIRERYNHSVWPEQTRKAIRTSIQDAIRDPPSVLINTFSGRLCNKSEQAAAFEAAPAFTRLVASMTTHINHALIEQTVREFYRYATFSHTWEANEPPYKMVIKTVVYNLKSRPTHVKLRTFCKIVLKQGFNWAWSDTCCIDRGDNVVLQEALVSMFKWYEGSALTIIFLCDVDRLAEFGALMRSLWNSRGWTLQEYHASKVVQIYTKDWTPYLGLTIYNHKESPEIILEMEKATGISAKTLMALRPGLMDIREKLRLASTRRTTRVEDAAYSLLGIFSMTMPATYGEEDKALGRLLSQLLTSSGDTSILAWTGISGSFNSCLPTNIRVFSRPPTSHIPPAIPHTEMATTTARLRASSLDLDLVTRLYDKVDRLPIPIFAILRMKLPCITFKIRLISCSKDVSGLIFHAQAGALGTVEIKTKQNLALVDSLYLVHPWIDYLLDRHATGNVVDLVPREGDTLEFDISSSFDSSTHLSGASDDDPMDDASLSSPSMPSMDAQMEFLARLRQPFGALLLTPTRRNTAECRRIATESLITVQVEEITSATLNRLIQDVRVLDVL